MTSQRPNRAVALSADDDQEVIESANVFLDEKEAHDQPVDVAKSKEKELDKFVKDHKPFRTSSITEYENNQTRPAATDANDDVLMTDRGHEA